MAVVVTEKPALKTGSLMTIISSKIDFLRLKTRLSSVEKKLLEDLVILWFDAKFRILENSYLTILPCNFRAR